jgi:hypothetical protein
MEATIVNKLSLLGACFSSVTIRVGFLVDKAILVQICLPVFQFSSASKHSINSTYSSIKIHEVHESPGGQILPQLPSLESTIESLLDPIVKMQSNICWAALGTRGLRAVLTGDTAKSNFETIRIPRIESAFVKYRFIFF